MRKRGNQERLYPYNGYDMRYERMTMEAFNRTPKMAVFIWYLVSRFTFYTIYFAAQGQTTQHHQHFVLAGWMVLGQMDAGKYHRTHISQANVLVLQYNLRLRHDVCQPARCVHPES